MAKRSCKVGNDEQAGNEPVPQDAAAAGASAAAVGRQGASQAGAAAAARRLFRCEGSGALATALATDDARPFASLVTYACDSDGSPIFLFSTLADHTRNLAGDARAALLVENASGRTNPQTGPRLTLVGRIAPDDTPRLRRRFLARHPGAELYAGFADFRIFRMQVERGHWVGGFAQARWLTSERLLSATAAAEALGEGEPDVLAHMNDDHAGTVALFATALLGRSPGAWRMSGVDPEGADLRCGNRFARLSFPTPVTDTAALRAVLSALALDARSGAAGGAADTPAPQRG